MPRITLNIALGSTVKGHQMHTDQLRTKISPTFLPTRLSILLHSRPKVVSLWVWVAFVKAHCLSNFPSSLRLNFPHQTLTVIPSLPRGHGSQTNKSALTHPHRRIPGVHKCGGKECEPRGLSCARKQSGGSPLERISAPDRDHF